LPYQRRSPRPDTLLSCLKHYSMKTQNPLESQIALQPCQNSFSIEPNSPYLEGLLSRLLCSTQAEYQKPSQSFRRARFSLQDHGQHIRAIEQPVGGFDKLCFRDLFLLVEDFLLTQQLCCLFLLHIGRSRNILRLLQLLLFQPNRGCRCCNKVLRICCRMDSFWNLGR
jgi:hypothetical protein